ncbi:fibronectin type III domain-containing protein [Portibacter lacus]|uniref:Fibronectin type-III domain-containing protein n=1 Tax=Portibacter lacus TaxID=1099794 RepID=A0AA37SPQ4_9BACT|nr:hypothetical protein [Portibacter lacus]GLR18466.1 hypothetical protein GCM10007940_30820 [Portibacter lacus]
MKIIICALYIIISCTTGTSQGISLYQKIKGDSLFVRWECESPHVWYDSNQSGYRIKISNTSSVVLVDTIIENKTQAFANFPDSSVEKMIYYLNDRERLPENMRIRWLDPSQSSELQMDSISEEIVYSQISQKRKFLEISGVMAVFKLDITQNLLVEIKPNNAHGESNSLEQLIKPSKISEQTFPNISSKWKNKRVELSWSTKGTKKNFLFYNLYFSDDGDNWEKVDSLYTNFYKETDDEELLTINPVKQLPHNDSIYYFKIHGVDFFGDESEDFSLVKGSGSKGIQVSPYWKKVKQLRTNEAEMKWEIPDEYASEVEEFRIYVAENYDGPYFADTIGIQPFVRELTREIPFKSAYFRVVAVDQNEEEFSSFPQLVIGVDTVAPAVPTNLSYTIDTTGRIDINWDPNDEEDFIGYKLFYSFDTTVDMTLAHNSYLVTPDFTDTLSLRSTNREVFYKAISVDKRNNRSDFSEILVVIRPDILPPVEPVFISAEPGPGFASLTWYKSVSDDVKEQRLFRRKMKEETSWELLELWDYNIDTTYIDSGLVAFEKYAYTITVIDSSGNESDPSRPVVVMPRPDYRGFDIGNWDIALDGNQVKITHGYQPSDFEKIFVYLKIEDGELLSIGELNFRELIFIDDGIQKDKNYNYAIKVMFKEGIETPLSEFKVVRR